MSSMMHVEMLSQVGNLHVKRNDGAVVRYKGTNYDADGEIEYYEIYEYDNAGNRTGLTRYTADGELMY